MAECVGRRDNRDDWAILHLKETLERAKKEKVVLIKEDRVITE